MRFLSEIARPGSAGLQAAVETRGGLSALRCLQARTIPHIEIIADVGTDDEPQRWRYLVRVNVVKREKFATVVQEKIWSYDDVIEDRSRSEGSDPLEFSQTNLGPVLN